MGTSLLKQAKLLWRDVRAIRRGMPANQYEISNVKAVSDRIRKYMGAGGLGGPEMLGHYDGANTGRLYNDWTTANDTQYNNLADAREKLIARSNKLCDNNPHAVGVLNTLVSNVIGEGLRPTPRVKTLDGRSVEGVNKALAEGWKRYNDEWDASGQQTFLEAQAMIYTQLFTDGAVLSNTVESMPGSYLGRSTQILTSLRLDSSRDKDNPELSSNPEVARTAFGINLNRNGRPLSYWVQGVDAPVSAKLMKVHFRRVRAEQILAPPWLVAALKYLWSNEKLIEDELIASRLQAMIGLFIPNTMMDHVLDKQLNTDSQVEFEPGKVWHGPDGSEPKVIQASDQITKILEPMQRLLLHAVTMTQGLSYQTVTRDVGEISMASGRINTNGDRRTYRVLQKWFAKNVCQWEYDKFVERMFFEGKMQGVAPIAAYVNNPWHYQQVQWRAPGFDFIDPSREAKAMVELYDKKMMTLEQYYGERGEDWRPATEQWLEEKAFIQEKSKELGIEEPIPSPVGGNNGGNGQGSGNDDDDKPDARGN